MTVHIHAGHARLHLGVFVQQENVTLHRLMVGGTVEMRGQLHGIIAQRLADFVGAVLGDLASPVNDVLTGGGIKAAVIAACVLHLHPCPAYIFDGLPHSRFVVGHAGGHAQNGLIYGLLVGHGYGSRIG